MFIIDLNYVAPLEELDKHMFDHVQYLKKYYEENLFLASGRKVPRTGGIILCIAESEKEVNQIISEDPFINSNWRSIRSRNFWLLNRILISKIF